MMQMSSTVTERNRMKRTDPSAPKQTKRKNETQNQNTNEQFKSKTKEWNNLK